jgi:hypothetical protein
MAKAPQHRPGTFGRGVEPRPDPQFWRDQHRRLGTKPFGPVVWRDAARELERATVILWNQWKRDVSKLTHGASGSSLRVCLTRPTALLAGLTIEGFLKAAIVDRGQPAPRTHKLTRLAREAQVGLSKNETDLLVRLEAFVQWAGRYPVPLKPEDMMPRRLPAGGFGLLTRIGTNDLDVWRGLVTRLCKRPRQNRRR